MEQLINRIADMTGKDQSLARTALGFILLFLRDEAPMSRIGELIDKHQVAHQAVSAALAASDGGLTSAMAASESFIGKGQFDTLALESKLSNLGFDKAQIDDILTEVFSHADTLIGADGLEHMQKNHPEFASVVEHATRMREQTMARGQTAQPRPMGGG